MSLISKNNLQFNNLALIEAAKPVNNFAVVDKMISGLINKLRVIAGIKKKLYAIADPKKPLPKKGIHNLINFTLFISSELKSKEALPFLPYLLGTLHKTQTFRFLFFFKSSFVRDNALKEPAL